MKRVLLAMALWLWPMCVAAASDDSPHTLRREYAGAGAGLTLSEQLFDTLAPLVLLGPEWLFQAGDSAVWASPQYDDSHWRLTPAPSEQHRELRSDWPGVGWFRFRLAVDSTLQHTPLLMLFQLIGACEVYVNGELFYSVGTVGATADDETAMVVPNPSGGILPAAAGSQWLVAVRYSQQFRCEHGEHSPLPPTLIAGVYRANEGIPLVRDWNNVMASLQVAFWMAALMFALVHLLIYVFNRHDGRRISNLYLAAFSFACAQIAFLPFEANGRTMSADEYVRTISLFKLYLVATGVFGPLFLYKEFYDKIPKQFWVILAGGTVTAALAWALPEEIVFAFVAPILLEMMRVVILAVVRKRPGAWIVMVGYGAFAVLCGLQIVWQWIYNEPPTVLFGFPYLFGILLLLICMSVYLAKSIAQTNLKLAVQLAKVTELSDLAVKQEREAKEQEMQRRLLEQEIQHNEAQLEKARSLEVAHRELEQAHADLRRAQAHLVQSEKMASMGMLVAGVAHEINTPVGAISSMHDTLMRAIDRLRQTLTRLRLGDDPVRDEIDRSMTVIGEANQVIQSGCDRVTTIVRRLRSFARLDEAELKTVDLREGIEDTLTMVHHELKHKAEVVRQYDDIPPVACYPSQLNQVFLNLLVNAGHANEGRGTITIRTYADGPERICIDIEDTGCGIPSEHLTRVFDPGFTTKGVGVGTGLGLSICYQIMQDHHGELRVVSEVGRGTTFTVCLPRDLEARLGQRAGARHEPNGDRPQ